LPVKHGGSCLGTLLYYFKETRYFNSCDRLLFIISVKQHTAEVRVGESKVG